MSFRLPTSSSPRRRPQLEAYQSPHVMVDQLQAVSQGAGRKDGRAQPVRCNALLAAKARGSSRKSITFTVA